MVQIELNNVDVDFKVGASVRATLKSAIADLIHGRAHEWTKTVHALRSVSFRVETGERVGLIGPNGAGKSTVLKVLAGIYPPQRGRVTVKGHLVPLFEFVTGFEMNDSGWDNIRIRALLLGMPWKEIERKVCDIGRFTGLGEFLDYPVRTYSSGMLLRLAFAVSTAVRPEILLLDEVMAAGDAAFRETARARMNDMMQEASIVMFATHDLGTLPDFCQRTIWLDHGRVRADGPTQKVTEAYKQSIVLPSRA